MSIKTIKQETCQHTFVTKGSEHGYVRECTKCHYFTVHVG